MIVSQIKDLIQTTEVMLFIEEVYLNLLRYPVFWKIQLTQLTLQLLCVCEVSLNITGECSSLIHLLEHSVELLKEVRIVRSFNISCHLHWSFSSKVSILFYFIAYQRLFLSNTIRSYFCDPMDCSLLGSSFYGIFQARKLEWVAIPFSRGSSRPGIELGSPT